MEVVQARPPDLPGEVAEGVASTRDFVDCYRVHYRRVVRALRLSGADLPTAEDLAQEAFGRALVHWRRVRRGTNPPGYVYTSAFRLLARLQSRPVPPDGADPSSTARPEAEAAPTESAALAAVAVERTLAGMPPRRRACAVMCLVIGLPVAEVAGALGVADGTVRKHLEEARRDLRESCPPPG
jgi:RNA polymerase sigma factor (sigma-70 family)